MVAVTMVAGNNITVNGTSSTTTSLTFLQHLVALTVALLVTLAAVEVAKTTVSAHVLFVDQRGTMPNNAPRHKHQCSPSRDIVKSSTFMVGHHP